MRFNAPTKLFFNLSLLVAGGAVLSTLGFFGDFPQSQAVWLGLLAWALLAIGTIFKGA